MIEINEYFLIPPNWANPIIYRRRWQTTISSSLKGNEQRSGLLTWPRRTIVFNPLTRNFTESAFIKRKLHKNIHNVWGIPFWQDRTYLTSQASENQDTLDVESTEDRNFEVGALCILLASPSFCEVGTIASKTEKQIILEDDLDHTWPAGTDVYPVLKARIKSGQIINLGTSQNLDMEIEASEEYEDSITRHIGTALEFPTYPADGYPIFNIEPDWSNLGEQGFIHPYDYLSFYGKTLSISHYDETEFTLRFGYLQKLRSELQKILDFFDDKMGRWGNLWIPSWQSDIRVTAPFGAGDNQLTIEDIKFGEYWLDEMAGSHITLLWPDGTRINRQIIGAPSTTEITLDNTVGKACTASELNRLLVSFLLFARFNQDEIEVEYISDEIGRMSLTFKTLFSEGLS